MFTLLINQMKGTSIRVLQEELGLRLLAFTNQQIPMTILSILLCLVDQ
jgi:hypothetical protein